MEVEKLEKALSEVNAKLDNFSSETQVILLKVLKEEIKAAKIRQAEIKSNEDFVKNGFGGK